MEMRTRLHQDDQRGPTTPDAPDRTIESRLSASTGGAATATTSAAATSRSTAAAALSHTAPLDQRPSVSVVAALSPCNQQSLHASPSSSSQSGSSSLLLPDPASSQAQAEAAWANPPSLPRLVPRSGRRLSDKGEEEVEEEGEITETRSSAQAAADYAAQMNPVADASSAAAPVAASTPQHEAAAGDFGALAGTSGGQAEQLSGWGSVTDIDAESDDHVAVSSPVDSAAGTAPDRETSQGASAADHDFGVGSTVVRRNVRGEFVIYTIRGLTSQGDKVRLVRPEEDRSRVAAPFDEIFIPTAAADMQPGAQPVWALFDRNLDQPLIDLTAPPDWTTIYYFAQVSDDQEGATEGVRIVYRDSVDDGVEALIPTEADILGRRMPGVVKPRPLSQAELACLKALPVVSTPHRSHTRGRSARLSARGDREQAESADAPLTAALPAAATGAKTRKSSRATRLHQSSASIELRADEPLSGTTQPAATAAVTEGEANGASIGVPHSASAAAAAEGSSRSRLSPSGASPLEPPPAAAAPSTPTMIAGSRKETRVAAGPRSGRARSSPSSRLEPPSATAAEPSSAAMSVAADGRGSRAAAAVEPGGASPVEPAASAAAVSVGSGGAPLLIPASAAPLGDDETLARICAAMAAGATAAAQQSPDLRQLLDERKQLAELRLQHQSLKRKSEADVQAAQVKLQRVHEERQAAKRESAALKEQLEERATECAKLGESIKKAETDHQSHKRKAAEELTAARQERDAAVAASNAVQHELTAAALRERRLRAGMAAVSGPSLLSPLCVDHDAVQCAVRRPCGHAARCADCAEADIGKQCPACRRTVEAVVRIQMHEAM